MRKADVNSVRREYQVCGNRIISRFIYSLVLTIMLFSLPSLVYSAVKEPNVSGSFYPTNPKLLSNSIENFLAEASPFDIDGDILVIISPHAGYEFSGRTAAYGFKALKDTRIKRVIILGPSHYTLFKGLATSGVNFYETPLGKVKVDRELSDELYKLPLFQGPRDAELPEHSLEMQLPFLQVILEDFVIVPLVVSEMSPKDYEEAAAVLKKYLDNGTVVVVSSDFTHFGGRFGYVPFRDNVKENLKELDGKAIDKIISKDLDGFIKYLDETGATICGARPIGVLIKMLPPSSQGTLLNYYTSGDLLNDYSDTVSYASIIFTLE